MEHLVNSPRGLFSPYSHHRFFLSSYHLCTTLHRNKPVQKKLWDRSLIHTADRSPPPPDIADQSPPLPDHAPDPPLRPVRDGSIPVRSKIAAAKVQDRRHRPLRSPSLSISGSLASLPFTSLFGARASLSVSTIGRLRRRLVPPWRYRLRQDLLFPTYAAASLFWPHVRPRG